MLLALVGAVRQLPGLISWLTSTLSTKEKLFLFQALLEASSFLVPLPAPLSLLPACPHSQCTSVFHPPTPANEMQIFSLCPGSSLKFWGFSCSYTTSATIDHAECLWQGTDSKVPNPKTVTLAKNTDLNLSLDLSCRQAGQRDVSE